jgi:leucyl aminopeptidase
MEFEPHRAPPGRARTRSPSGSSRTRAIAHDSPDGALQRLVESARRKAAVRKLAVTHDGGKRWLIAGLGKRDEFDAERAGSSPAA